MPSRRARQRRRHAPRICAALVGELHAARSRGTPTLPALELRLPNEKGNLSGETTLSLTKVRLILFGFSFLLFAFRGGRTLT